MRSKFLKLLRVFCVGLSAMCCLFGCGCTGTRKIVSLQSKGLYSGNEISFPIKSSSAHLGYSFYGMTTFYSKQNPDKLCELIEESNSDLILRKYHDMGWGKGDTIFIERDNGNGTKDYFSIILLTRNAKGYWYECNPLRAEIAYAIVDGGVITFDLLLPVHLIPQYDYTKAFYLDVEYEIKGSPDEFYDFYEQSGWFDLEKDETGFTIKGFRPGPEIKNDRAKVDFAFRFDFRDVLDMSLFKIRKA